MKFPENVDLGGDLDHRLESGISKGFFIFALISNNWRYWALAVTLCTLRDPSLVLSFTAVWIKATCSFIEGSKSVWSGSHAAECTL